MNKRRLFLSVLLVCLLTASLSAMELPRIREIWTLEKLVDVTGGTVVSGGPTTFTLHGHVSIPPTETFQISAGEYLLVEDEPDGTTGWAIYVQGQLVIQGTKKNPAVIRSSPDAEKLWLGIYLHSQSVERSMIQGAVIEDALLGLNVMSDRKPVVEDCVFRRCGHACVNVGPGHGATIRGNEFHVTDYSAGVVANGAGELVVEDNRFIGGPVGAVSVKSAGETRFAGNRFEGVDYAMNAMAGDRASFENNVIDGGSVGMTGFSLEEDNPGAANENILSGNVFSNQKALGLSFGGYAGGRLRDNDFAGSSTVARVFINDQAELDLGTEEDPGENVFKGFAPWDLVNASENDQTAVGNDWSDFGAAGVYDQAEDEGDADENGVISGLVLLGNLLKISGWMSY